ncbi:SEC10/PgrA surface exclusion domain-containing protein [Limosilactobacillus caviae]|uniref:SEC10/PgrA surface exclusion domain-containing protein n=1 Tax=Limosilactobacillus caviae TaxID=1769424 RepID=UPI00129AA330|nr:SEC10/PgrA surface exclusion domain-containing protein [Limosilactobacillus caviae]MCD7123241.1 SEC10/PgrA surface exclusion domain-containing protein [Limosilactobacillus caviae]MRH46713.1 SEC10/PgrA surface exclusion domain-containing protein [Limosilactobacillus reuteri]
MKEHKKLYKSGKLWMTATVMALAAGTTMATTTAHADATPAANTTSETQTADQVAQQEQKVNADHDAVNKAQNAVDASKKEIDQASQDLQKAQQDQQNAQSQVDALKNSSMSSDQAQSTIDYLTKKANYYQQADLQRKEEQAQGKITNLQDQINDLNSQTETAEVPNGRIDKSKSLLENVARNNLWDNYYDSNMNASTWNKNVVPNNIYVSPDNNKAQDYGTISPNGRLTSQIGSEYQPYLEIDKIDKSTGMTEDQARELSILLINELNHARAQRGLAPFVMTEEQFKRAMARAAQPSAANLEHNENDMDNVLGNWHSENLSGLFSESDMISQFEWANDAVLSMLNRDDDSNWGHRDNFLEDGNYNVAFGFKRLADSSDGDYVLTFDTTYATDADKANDLVTNTINNYAAMGPTKDATANDQKLNSQISDLKQQISTLQDTIKQLSNKEDNLQFDASYLSKAEQDQYNEAKAQLNSSQSLADAQAKLQQAAETVKKAQLTKDSLEGQSATLQNQLDNAKATLAKDQELLDKIKTAQQGTDLQQKDNEKYTNLEPSLIMKVNVTAGDTNIPAPKLSNDAFIKDTNANTASAATFMVLATNGTYPEGTKVEWTNLANVQKNAQNAGTYDEEVILDFPDGTKSKAFTVPGVLVVAAKQTPSTDPTKPDNPSTDPTKPSTGDGTHTTDPTTPTETNHTLMVHYIETTGYTANGTPITKVVGTQTFTGKKGDTFSGSQLNIPAGYKLAMDGVSYTIGDQDETNNTPVVSVNTPSDNTNQPSTNSTTPTDNKTNDRNADTQLPAGAKVVNNQVVDANDNVLASWKVVNGLAVKNTDQPIMTREAYKAQQQSKNNAKVLPQTGNNDNLAVMGLGTATLLGMFGLAGVNKKRN